MGNKKEEKMKDKEEKFADVQSKPVQSIVYGPNIRGGK